MRNVHPRSGTTLLELLVLCTLIGVITGASLPLVRGVVDSLAVAAARDQISAAAARTRALAVARGGATLMVDPARNLVWIETAESPYALPVDLEGEFGVRLSIDGTQEIAAVNFDALGIGRVASRTIRITRGDAEARLTISAFGRLRAS